MPSICDTLASSAARCPDREALVFGDRRRTYRQFAADVDRCAAALAAAGTQPGDRVLLMATNTDAFVIAAYAALRAGAILVPGNPQNAPPEIAHLISDSGATTVIVAAEFADAVAAGIGTAEPRPRVFALGPGTPFADLLAEPARPAPAQRPAEGDEGLLLYTSGTTG
jgi:acyl-CoA synthetase (AMP-forming)/AMP-acid ligase II